MKLYKTAILFACVMFSSCTSASIKDNKIVIVKGSSKVQSSINAVSNKLNVDGVNQFISVNYERIPERYEDCAVITVAPDGSSVFLAEILDEASEDTTMIIGHTPPRINLIRVDMKTFEATVLSKDISFINIAKWNSQGTVVGFCGGEEIRIYSNEKNKFLFQNETANDSVTYFGWSPQGDRIFTEHPNIINGNIYYLDLNKVLYSYEAKENIYYRGILNEDYYYAASMATTSLSYSMLIVNASGNVVYKGDSGRFRDSYENQMLYIGSTGAGLYYHPDVNDMGVRQTLTNRFVHDVKFVYGGNIAYIDSNSDMDKNNYILHIVNHEGKELASMEVSGPVFILSPDGAYGWVGGSCQERIDFRVNSSEKRIIIQNSLYSYEDNKVLSTVKNAVNVWHRVQYMASITQGDIDTWFVDSDNPKQSAKLDMQEYYDGLKERQERESFECNTQLYLKSYKRYTSYGYERASVHVYGSVTNSYGTESPIDQCMELISMDGKWYVTGLSTFPMEQETKEVRSIIEDYVKQIKAGTVLDELLKDADIQIGQLQFWNSDGESMATDISASGYCKAYLIATKEGTRQIYKLVLKKSPEGAWEVSLPTKEAINRIF